MAATVRITLLGQEFRLQTDEPEASLQAAAADVQARLDQVRQLTGGQLPQLQQALLAALQLAGDLRKQQAELAAVGGRVTAVQSLLGELDALAANQAAAIDQRRV